VVFVTVLYPVLSIDWNPGREAKENCRKLQDADFGPDLYVLQGKDISFSATLVNA
jgi:hypothetical protein